MSRYIFDMEVGTKILREQNPVTKETQIILVNCICKLHVILILNIFYLLFSLINDNFFSSHKQNLNYESLISDIKNFSILTVAPANLNYISWHWFQSRSGTIFQLYTASFPEVDALSLAKDVTSIVLRHFKSYVVSLYANQSKKNLFY